MYHTQSFLAYAHNNFAIWPAGCNIALGAAKSRFGHAETGAGAVGLLETVEACQRRMRAPLLHLREMNSYVSSILDASAKPLNGAQLPTRSLNPPKSFLQGATQITRELKYPNRDRTGCMMQ